MTTSSFVLFGTGGLARELTAWIVGSGGRVEGYVTSAPEQHAQYSLPGVLLDEDRPSASPALIAIGAPTIKQAIFGRATSKGWWFGSFVHPSAVLGSSISLSEGAVIAPSCTLSVDVTLGRCSFVNFNCGIGHDVIIGDFVQINPGAQIGGNCRIGSNSLIGSGTTVIEETAIGRNCIIGSGSVIYSRVRDGARMIGAVAKRWPQ